MVYTVDVIDGKIELPKPWKNKKRLRLSQEKGRFFLEEDLLPEELRDENIELYDNNTGIHFKKGLSGEGLRFFCEQLKHA